MSKDQGMKKTEREQKPIPATKKEQQKIKLTELTDADLDKVAGGMNIIIAAPGVLDFFNPKEISIDKSVPWKTGKK